MVWNAAGTPTFESPRNSDSFFICPIRIPENSLFVKGNTQMRNLSQIFRGNTGKICAFGLIVVLMWGLTPAAEGISAKLRGKIVLGGVLTGIAYLTHTFVARDRRATAELELHLGPPDRVVQFERGFDRWRINYYGEQGYLFRNGRFMERLPSETRGRTSQLQVHFGVCPCDAVSPFLTDTLFSKSPRWLSPSLVPSRRAPQFVSFCPYRLAFRPWHPRRLLEW